jgi:hypothetical protein
MNIKPYLITGFKNALALIVGLSIMCVVMGRPPKSTSDWWITVAVAVVGYCIIVWLARLASSRWGTSQKRSADGNSN